MHRSSLTIIFFLGFSLLTSKNIFEFFSKIFSTGRGSLIILIFHFLIIFNSGDASHFFPIRGLWLGARLETDFTLLLGATRPHFLWNSEGFLSCSPALVITYEFNLWTTLPVSYLTFYKLEGRLIKNWLSLIFTVHIVCSIPYDMVHPRK